MLPWWTTFLGVILEYIWWFHNRSICVLRFISTALHAASPPAAILWCKGKGAAVDAEGYGAAHRAAQAQI